MVALARERLRAWASRAEIVLSEGVVPPGVYDRFVSTYVLDLLSEEAIQAVLADAARVVPLTAQRLAATHRPPPPSPPASCSALTKGDGP